MHADPAHMSRQSPTGSDTGRLRLLLAVGTLVLLATLGVGVTLILARAGENARLSVERALERTAHTLENTVNNHLLAVDSALASLPSLLSSLTDQNGTVTPERANSLMRGLDSQNSSFRNVWLLREDGSTWASSAPRPTLSFDLDPTALKPSQGPGSVAFAGPIRNTLTGDWSLVLARPIRLPGSDPLLAVADLPLANLVRSLRQAEDIPGIRIRIELATGALLASFPHDEVQIGKVQTPALANLRADGKSFLLDDADRGPAFTVVRPSLYRDIVVGAVWDDASALADWRHDRNNSLGLLLLTTALLLLFAALLSLALRRQERLERERAGARSSLQNAIGAMSDGFVMWDRDDRLVTCNQRYLDQYPLMAPNIRPGITYSDMMRAGAKAGQFPEAGDDLDAFVEESFARHRGNGLPRERLLSNGRWLMVTDRSTPDGGVVGIRTDITALKQALANLADANGREQKMVEELRRQNDALLTQEKTLDQQNMRFDAALNNMPHGLLMVGGDGRLVVSNKRLVELFGISEADAQPGMRVDDLVAAAASSGAIDEDIIAKLRETQTGDVQLKTTNTFIARGRWGQALSVTQQPMEDGGWVAVYEDVTRQQMAENRIRFLAHYDDLTKLPNRILFRKRADEMLHGPVGERPRVGLLYLDLDRFKDINDSLGHSIGDALLERVANRLLENVRDGDVVARLTSDEFAVASRLGADDNGLQLADRLLAVLGQPYDLRGHRVTIGASIGIAVEDRDDNLDAEGLLRNADIALYNAKQKGRNAACLFKSAMEARLRSRLQLEADLQGAVGGADFQLAYQPLFDLAANKVSGFEALLRWNHPERGFISPADFVPVAEETGLITQIGRWVLHRACIDAATLDETIKVAVNLSPVQLQSEDLVDTVMNALQSAGLSATRLELEITETALLRASTHTLGRLHQLREAGIHIVLDDFGTGYSSLSHLQAFPFSKIKIDKSFVQEMTARADSAAIVRSVVGLAHQLGMCTTAEGIETLAQLHAVRRTGCREAQGFLLGRPKSILDAPAALSSEVPRDEDRHSRSA